MKQLFILAVLAVIVCPLTFALAYNKSDVKPMAVIEVEEKIPDNGVLYVPLRKGSIEIGYYIVDTRFDLCFLHVTNALTQVSCENIKITQ